MMSELSGYQREVLAHIEFMGRFYGVVSRADLTARFEISDASATRALQLYNSLAPDNLIYRPNIRRYEWQDSADPIIEVSVDKCMGTLTDGFGDSFSHINVPVLAVKNTFSTVDLEILSNITRAIKRKSPIVINYLSKSTPSGGIREIVPHSVANSGLRWHIRAYDRKNQDFRDFVVNRIQYVKKAEKQLVLKFEEKQSDKEWNELITLEIQPHPRLKDISKMIEFEYRMNSGIIKKTCRKALAGYLLDSWNIDVSEDASLTGKHILLHLKNSQELDFKSKLLAPFK